MAKTLLLLCLSFALTQCGEKNNAEDLLPQNMTSDNYVTSAVSISPDGQVTSGPAAIAAKWNALFTVSSLPGRLVMASIPIGNNQKHTYEISRFATKAGQMYAQVIIWNNEGGTSLRALELVTPYNAKQSNTKAVDLARARWMEYCNAHAVEQLIQEMYTTNTLYYNHRPLLRGRTALIQEYGYMKNPDYQLNLTPLHVVPVAEDLVFEIGQCSGSYGGKYLIVWQQQSNGNWQVLLDANL